MKFIFQQSKDDRQAKILCIDIIDILLTIADRDGCINPDPKAKSKWYSPIPENLKQRLSSQGININFATYGCLFVNSILPLIEKYYGTKLSKEIQIIHKEMLYLGKVSSEDVNRFCELTEQLRKHLQFMRKHLDAEKILGTNCFPAVIPIIENIRRCWWLLFILAIYFLKPSIDLTPLIMEFMHNESSSTDDFIAQNEPIDSITHYFNASTDTIINDSSYLSQQYFYGHYTTAFHGNGVPAVSVSYGKQKDSTDILAYIVLIDTNGIPYAYQELADYIPERIGRKDIWYYKK